MNVLVRRKMVFQENIFFKMFVENKDFLTYVWRLITKRSLLDIISANTMISNLDAPPFNMRPVHPFQPLLET